MSENITGAYAPGTYVKGSIERVASTSREAVALAFDGFKRKADPVKVDPQHEEPKAPEALVVAPRPIAPKPPKDDK